MNPKKRIIPPKKGEVVTAKFLKELADSVNRLESMFGGTGLNGMVSSDFIALSAFGGGDGESNVFLGTLGGDAYRNKWTPVTLYDISDNASIDPVNHPTWNPNSQFSAAGTGYCFTWTLPAGWKIPNGSRVSLVRVGTSVDSKPLFAAFDWDKCPRYVGA